MAGILQGINLSKVKVIVIDMWKTAKTVINKIHALIVVDRFHVIKEVNGGLVNKEGS